MTRLEQLEDIVTAICAELGHAAEYLERERNRLNKLARAHNRTVLALSAPRKFPPGWSRRTAMAKATWAKRRPM